MKKWLATSCWALSLLVLIGCARTTVSPAPALEDRIRQLEQENAALAARAAALEQAQEELRWLHIHLEKNAGIDPPQSAVEAYLQAFIQRNGAAARLYLSPAMRTKLNMPTHGIGTSDWPFRRYKIISETEVAKDKYQYQVLLCGDVPVCEGTPETYTVEKQRSDTSNNAWLITDIQ